MIMYTHVCIYMSVYICEYNMRLQTTRTKKHRKESLKSKSTAQHNLRMGLNHSEEERGNERVLSILLLDSFSRLLLSILDFQYLSKLHCPLCQFDMLDQNLGLFSVQMPQSAQLSNYLVIKQTSAPGFLSRSYYREFREKFKSSGECQLIRPVSIF